MSTFSHTSGIHLSVGNANIYYEVTGNPEGPVLVFLHGGFCTMETFNGVLPAFAENYKIIGVDTRGHGKSTLGSEALTYERIEKDVEAVLEHLGVETFSIIGFSDGGIVAYRLAGSGKWNVEHVVTIGSEWSTEHAKEKFPMYEKVTADFWIEKHPEDYEAYQRLNPEPDFENFTKVLVGLWSDASSSGYPNEFVDGISCPVLAIRGEGDFLVSSKSVQALANRVASVQALEISQAMHDAHNEQPKVFIEACEGFLR